MNGTSGIKGFAIQYKEILPKEYRRIFARIDARLRQSFANCFSFTGCTKRGTLANVDTIKVFT